MKVVPGNLLQRKLETDWDGVYETRDSCLDVNLDNFLDLDGKQN